MCKLFKRKRTLREVCREMYGDDFIILYDMLEMGTPIGSFSETIEVLDKIETAKRKMNEKEKEE